MFKIFFNNITARITPQLDWKIANRIYEELSYEKQGSFFSGAWDDRERLFNRKYQTFSTGLLYKVRKILDHEGILFQLVDQRVRPEPGTPWKSNIEPWPFQQEAVDLAIKRTRGVIRIATGGGKTICFAAIIAKLGLSALVITQRTVIIHQTYDRLKEYLPNTDIGIACGGEFEVGTVMVVSAAKAARALNPNFGKKKRKKGEEIEVEKVSFKNEAQKQVLKHFIRTVDVIITDECHHQACDSFSLISKEARNAFYRYGASVHPDAQIELCGGLFGGGWMGRIEDAFLYASKIIKPIKENGCEIINLIDKKVLSRSWDENKQMICWQSVKKIIQHDYVGKMFNISANKFSLKVTKDHSIFVYENGNLLEKKPKELKLEDNLPIDSGKEWFIKEKSTKISIMSILEKSSFAHKIRIGCNLDNITYHDLDIHNRELWQLRHRSHHGPSLNFKQYRKFSNKVGPISWIWWEHCNNQKVKPIIDLKEFAYLFGFYLGNGWLYDNTLGFSMHIKKVEKFINKLQNIKSFIFHFKIKAGRSKKCKQIIFSNKAMNLMFRFFFEGQDCYTKRIPAEWIISWPEEMRLELLEGLMDSDGYAPETRPSRTYSTCSKQLARDFMKLLTSLSITGRICGIRRPGKGGIIRGRQIIGKADNYLINFSIEKVTSWRSHKKYYYEDNKCRYAFVKNISSDFYEGKVYDIEMKNHPSFLANGFLVHNSGTTFRDDKATPLIYAHTARKISDISATELVNQGYLVPLTITTYRIPRAEKLVSKMAYPEVYQLTIVENEYRNNLALRTAAWFASQGKSVIVAVTKLEHGHALLEAFENTYPDIPATFMRGEILGKNRKEILNKLIKKEILVMFATTVVGEGFDCCSLDCLINLKGAKSKVDTIQLAGRVTRIHPAKSRGYIVDFNDLTKYMKRHHNRRMEAYCSEACNEIHQNIKFEDLAYLVK